MWKAIQAAYEAGGEIMKIYNTDFEVDYKADESPLTEADQASHNIIVRVLRIGTGYTYFKRRRKSSVL